MNKWHVGGIIGMLASAAVAVVAATNYGAVTYGAAEQTQTVATVVNGGTLAAILGAIGSVWALVKGGLGGKQSSLLDFGKQVISDLTTHDGIGMSVDAAFVVIAGCILAKKGAIDPQLLADLGALRQRIESGPTAPKPTAP